MAPSSPFAVAGMASTSNAHHTHNPPLNAWGGASTSTSFTDTLSQSRSHYQPGYLMSASQVNNSPGAAQRVEEAPVVQTKAKMNHAVASEFGMDSMFQSARHSSRQPLADSDGPPMRSVNDIPTEMHATDSSSSFQPRASAFSRASRPAPSSPAPPQTPLHYIIVFGYPPDKYTITTSYFASLASTASASPPEPHPDITNAFRIGYSEAADALRAVRKSGEVLEGSWMVGVKWADAAQAEALVAQPVARHSSPMDMAVDSPSSANSPGNNAYAPPTVGTPLKLAPSASAFRRAGPSSAPRPAPAPAPAPGWPSAVPNQAAPEAGKAAGKGVLGQVGDMIFGW
ncbi:hypothetical protein DFH07DRAFT_795293 [Mycena maculata]|uniref:RRM Nup35-type domain-containing protein n=1 Tax=Mycena maculata TaxID=230809 RepID=A0AAD7K7V8_9AGAR|nr:hypothetical protein DFH07DRAFT_795293 [Mycena maculata]